MRVVVPFSLLVNVTWLAVFSVRFCFRRLAQGRHAKSGQDLEDVLLRNHGAVELDPDQARAGGVSLQHAWGGGQAFGDCAGAPLVLNAADLPDRMTKAFGDRRAGRGHELAQAGERNHVGVVVDTKVRALGLFHNVGLGHAGPTADLIGEPLDAGVRAVMDLRQDQRDVELQRLDHAEPPDEARNARTSIRVGRSRRRLAAACRATLGSN